MAVVDYKTYCKLLDRAKEGKFAYPAFNVTSSETVNAVLLGLKQANADGIIQISTGGAEFTRPRLRARNQQFHLESRGGLHRSPGEGP